MFNLYVHKGGLKLHSVQFIFAIRYTSKHGPQFIFVCYALPPPPPPNLPIE